MLKILEKNHKNLEFLHSDCFIQIFCFNSEETETGNHRWCLTEVMRENSRHGNQNVKMLCPKLTENEQASLYFKLKCIV